MLAPRRNLAPPMVPNGPTRLGRSDASLPGQPTHRPGPGSPATSHRDLGPWPHRRSHRLAHCLAAPSTTPHPSHVKPPSPATHAPRAAPAAPAKQATPGSARSTGRGRQGRAGAPVVFVTPVSRGDAGETGSDCQFRRTCVPGPLHGVQVIDRERVLGVGRKVWRLEMAQADGGRAACNRATARLARTTRPAGVWPEQERLSRRHPRHPRHRRRDPHGPVPGVPPEGPLRRL